MKSLGHHLMCFTMDHSLQAFPLHRKRRSRCTMLLMYKGVRLFGAPPQSGPAHHFQRLQNTGFLLAMYPSAKNVCRYPADAGSTVYICTASVCPDDKTVISKLLYADSSKLPVLSCGPACGLPFGGVPQPEVLVVHGSTTAKGSVAGYLCPYGCYSSPQYRRSQHSPHLHRIA